MIGENKLLLTKDLLRVILLANPFLTVEEQKQIGEALDINNSDMELCEFNGRTIIYYSWGNQQGMEFLAEASFEGSMKEFLQGWFPTKHKENT